MYIQITNRCNMTCEHCCYSCGKKGEDMSLDTFRKALSLCKDYCHLPFLGGGEPTLHPEFATILLEAMACEIEHGLVVGIITNGSIKKWALLIAKLTKAEVLSGSVSQDAYHDPIDPEVVEAFENVNDTPRGHINHGFWDTSNKGIRDPMPHGRGVEFMGESYHDDDFDGEDNRDEKDCPCSDWMVKPNGDIHQCGCEDSPKIGHVDTGINSPCRDCFRSPWFIEECTEEGGEYEHLVCT